MLGTVLVEDIVIGPYYFLSIELKLLVYICFSNYDRYWSSDAKMNSWVPSFDCHLASYTLAANLLPPLEPTVAVPPAIKPPSDDKNLPSIGRCV